MTPDLQTVFLTIGAMKCGTSSLHQYLDLHPEIYMSRVKELDFFLTTESFAKGLDWYRRQLRGPGTVRGESSPNYTKYPHFEGVPERIASTLQDPKMIFVCRDPIRRTVSHYVHNVWDGRERRPFEEAMDDLGESNIYVTTSRYAYQLDRFRAHFDDELFLVLELEHLSQSPREVLPQVFAFLGVDPGFQHPDFDKVHHSSASKGRPPDWMKRMRRWPGGKALRSVVGPFFERPIERPRLSDELRRRLEDVFRPDVERLRRWSGQPLSTWSL